MERLSLALANEETRKETPAAVVVEPTPQALPAELELCLKRSMRPRKAAKKPADKAAADALVLAELKAKRQREVCAYQLFKWHEDQRTKVAVKK